ncbi:hypothetical protein Btru_064454 [Bulinus truncatus]|nr:hypothetical protein Btru_064454 [Bulinus truncatus]
MFTAKICPVEGKNHVVTACLAYTNMSKMAMMTSKWLVSRRHQFLYCPVEKVASTFWRRFLHQLEYTSPMKSPFDVSVQKVYGDVDTNIAVKEKGVKLQRLLLKTTKLLFVRDPYYRLFSAYVDKLLAPNPTYWKLWGVEAIGQFRYATPANFSDEVCGEDVSFREFVSFVTTPTGQADPHVMSINKLCSPCHVNYTIIGKMETFIRDTRLLIKQLGVDEGHIELDRMSEDVSRDAVEDSVIDSMSESWLNESLRCVSKADVVRRIWRKLQIRGFISWRIDYNMDQRNVRDINGPLLVEVLKVAAKASTNRTELKIQKSQALLEAFSTITEEQFASLKQVFQTDFQLFNYNARPDKLSRSRLDKVTYTGAFDWKKNWNLKSVL